MSKNIIRDFATEVALESLQLRGDVTILKSWQSNEIYEKFVEAGWCIEVAPTRFTRKYQITEAGKNAVL